MPVLPVEPGVAQLVSKDIPPSCYWETFSDVNRFRIVVPYAVGVRIPTVHVGVRDLPDGNVIAKGKDDFMWNPYHTCCLENEHNNSSVRFLD